MDWRGHLVVGALFCLVPLYFLFPFTLSNLPFLFLYIIFGSLCALAPDIDTELSKGKMLLDYGVVVAAFVFSFVSICASGYCSLTLPTMQQFFLVTFALLGLYFALFRFLKPRHRGITHTLAAMIVFFIFLFLALGDKFAFIGATGYLSHLVADGHIRLI